MALTLSRIEINPKHKHLQIREIKDNGSFHRRVLICGTDVSGEVQEIQDKAEAEWTDEVKDKWSTFQEEQNKEQS